MPMKWYDHLRYLNVSLEVMARSIIVFSMFLLIALEILSLPLTIRFFCSVVSSLRAAGSKLRMNYSFY